MDAFQEAEELGTRSGEQRNQSVGRFECAVTDGCHSRDSHSILTKFMGRSPQNNKTYSGDFSAPAAGTPTTTPFGAFCFARWCVRERFVFLKWLLFGWSTVRSSRPGHISSLSNARFAMENRASRNKHVICWLGDG